MKGVQSTQSTEFTLTNTFLRISGKSLILLPSFPTELVRKMTAEQEYSRPVPRSADPLMKALFSSENWKVFGTVALSFVCSKYCLIIN